MPDKLISFCRLLSVIAIAAIVSACIPPQSNRDNPSPAADDTNSQEPPAQETSTQQDNTPQPIILEPPADPTPDSAPEPATQTETVPESVTPEAEPVAEPLVEPLPEPVTEPVIEPEIIAVPEPAPPVVPKVTPETPQIEEVVTEPAPVIATPEPVAEPLAEPVAEPVAVPDPAPAVVPTPAPPSAASSTLRGRLTLTADNDRYLQANAIAGAVIYFMPADGTHTVTPGSFEVGTRNKRLVPDVLAVPVGSEVVFPNYDEILHNVFSVSPAAMFDLGFINANESASYVFNKPGQVLVHCNVHHAMRADILVLDTPYYAQPDLFGNFQIENVPAGAGELRIWHPQASEDVQTLRTPALGTLDLELELIRPRVPTHLNKNGESYRASRSRN